MICFFLLGIAVLTTACGSSASSSNTSSAGVSSIASSGSSLVISPASITLAEGNTYTFSASGGSGSGYTFSIASGSGSTGLISTTGYYYTGQTGTGTSLITVTDSAGSVAYATVTIGSSSGDAAPTSNYSVTGSLSNCVGISGGSLNTNTWEANGTELRSINDLNYSEESPVYCTGLSVAGQIPSTATITGVKVSLYLINQSANMDGSMIENLGLVYSNTVIGSLNGIDFYIPGNSATFPTFTEGGITQNFGAPLTPAIVNDSSFGIDIQTYRAGSRLFTGDAASNFPQVTIYYSM